MPPPTLESDESRIAGKSLIALGLVSLLSTVAVMLRVEACSAGLGGVIIFMLGLELRRDKGKRSTATWGMGCMAWCALASVFSILAIIFDWGLRVGGKPLADRDVIWVLPCIVIFGAWVAINLWLCARVLRYHRRLDRNLCPACGYPVGTSNVCTECGKTRVQV